MSGEPDDEDLERLLDADRLSDNGADPLAALLRAAAAPDPDRALRGEEAASAAFRAAFTPQSPASAPRRGTFQRIRIRRGTSAALLAAALLVLAGLALPRIAGRDPHNGPSLTATTAPLTSPRASPRTPDTTPRPLDDNATLTSEVQSSTSSGTPASAAPDPQSTETHAAKIAPAAAHSRTRHPHAAKK